ncbi:hypothetical protein D3OALGB2SA_873 [Olavius algarvensis associated proteobacterium Delta 3]|nr:hypothetical protein D3OALGB2SA_873 [Olavius algarvensis associated proteobacterium Delta 3]
MALPELHFSPLIDRFFTTETRRSQSTKRTAVSDDPLNEFHSFKRIRPSRRLSSLREKLQVIWF